jgi:hypothetical protein
MVQYELEIQEEELKKLRGKYLGADEELYGPRKKFKE